MSARATVVGAVAAQFSQAGASLLLSLVGIRLLTASDFGVLGILLGSLVLATALMTGVVGDSLTVLDRQQREVRRAIERLALAILVVVFAVGAAASWSTGLLSIGTALWFGAALVAFCAEDIVRRWLMAVFRFWSVVLVDLVYLVAAAAVLGWSYRAHGVVVVEDFLRALLIGQSIAAVLGLAMLPRVERWLAGGGEARIREVLAFGGWRAAQQMLRPITLLAMRVAVALFVSTAVLGQLEAARVYASPALLVAQGLAGYLLARFSRDRNDAGPTLLARADRAALGIAALSAIVGGLAVVGLPWLWPLISGSRIEASTLAVVAWSTFAVAVGWGMAYNTVNIVHGSQRRLLGVRLGEAVLGLTLVLAMLALGIDSLAVPFGLAVTALGTAMVMRRMARRSLARPAPAEPTGL